MRFQGFTGPSYQSLSKAAALERTVNYYQESPEIAGEQKQGPYLYPRAGSKPFSANPSTIPQAVRGMIEFDGNGVLDGAVLGVSGNTFWQIAPDGTVTNWGTVADDGLPVQIVANAASVGQIAVASAGHLYVLASGVFAEVPINDDFFGARGLAFIDGYFAVLSDTLNHQQFQICSLNNGRLWNAADVAILLGQADPLRAMIANQEYLVFLGARRGQLWYNTGNNGFPFAIESGAFIEVGTNAPASLVQSDTTVFWIGQDARGANVAMRLQGLQSRRISTHAVEAAWSAYPTTSDCICCPLTWNGHSLIRYIFPTADAGWEYDITESARVGYEAWTEISFTDANGNSHAPFERAHCYAFGKHLIGSGGADGSPGAVYEIDGATYEDAVGSNLSNLTDSTTTAQMTVGINDADLVIPSVNFSPAVPAAPFYFTAGGGFPTGELMLCAATAINPVNPIQATLTVLRGLSGTTAQTWGNGTALQIVVVGGYTLTRDRIVRLPYNGGLRQFLDRIEWLIQAGVGIDSGQGSDPQMIIRISRDGGNNWGPEISVSMGVGGAYQTRAIANRLGSYRDGAIWVRITDPVFAALIGAEHYIRQGGS